MLKMTGTIKKWGNGLGICLPKEIIDEALFSANERVELISDKMGIKIQKVGRPKTLSDLFKGYSGDYVYDDINADNSVGTEVW